MLGPPFVIPPPPVANALRRMGTLVASPSVALDGGGTLGPPVRRALVVSAGGRGATEWHGYLTERGYAVRVLAANPPYATAYPGPQPPVVATVAAVRQAVRTLVRPEIGRSVCAALIVCGFHGCYNDQRDCHLVQLEKDPTATTKSGVEGSYYGWDMANDIGPIQNGPPTTEGTEGPPPPPPRIFFFFDTCHSGGMIQRVIDRAPLAVGVTSATCGGRSVMNADDLFGQWSNRFLAELRSADGETGDLVALFFAARRKLARKFGRAVDQPCFFARTPTRRIDTNGNVNRRPRRGEFLVADWI